MFNGKGDGLALLISCVGRKLVMGGRVDEEVEAVGDVFGQGATLAGFYSYGEISPFTANAECKLHNQTMTITHIAEL
jgi:small ligand-binding sensory domain FIST